jgi:hypothetical protein
VSSAWDILTAVLNVSTQTAFIYALTRDLSDDPLTTFYSSSHFVIVNQGLNCNGSEKECSTQLHKCHNQSLKETFYLNQRIFLHFLFSKVSKIFAKMQYKLLVA